VSDDRARRRDAKWAARYARSQAKAERIARQDGADWPLPVASISTATTPNGDELRLRLIAPGEPTGEREYPFIILGYIGAFLMRGSWTPRTDNERWIVMVQRQRGPWRGFDTIYEMSFASSAEAVAHLQGVRHRIESGEPIPAAPPS
jgi:hypothetical protein